MTEGAELSGRLRTEIAKPGTRELLEAYFSRRDARFAGELFNTFGTNDPFSLGPDDLLVVGFLDEAFNAEAASKVLIEDRGAYERLLHGIPPDQDIWESSADVSDESLASEIWRRLKSINGVGPVRAGKLLARKRPRLIPIFDSVMDKVVQAPSGRYWLSMQEALRDDDLRTAVNGVRPPWLSPAVPTLRVLDAALWMNNSQSGVVRHIREHTGAQPVDTGG